MSMIYDMPAADYHAHPAISKSGLDLVARSPAHFKYAPPRKETDAMRVGTATHAAILEPKLYAKAFPVAVGAKDRKAPEYKDLVAKHGKSFVLMPAESAAVGLMAKAVRNTPEIAEVLAMPGHSEVTIITKDPVTGVEVRVRIDWLTGRRALDLKTTTDLRNDKFFKSVIDYRYHVQEAFYRDVFQWETGEKLQKFEFAVTESDVPHVSKLIDLPDDLVEWGRMIYRRDLNLYAQCLERDAWPGPEPEIRTLITPQWALYKMEDELGGLAVITGETA